MIRIARLKEALWVAEGDPELMRSQLQAFGRQIPLLYFILIVNTTAVAVTHVGSAPAWLSMYIPGTLGALCLCRCLRWWRARKLTWTAAQAVREIRSLTWVVGLPERHAQNGRPGAYDR